MEEGGERWRGEVEERVEVEEREGREGRRRRWNSELWPE